MALTQLTGMVLSSSNVGEYDRRMVILTKERGRITAFAKGARRPNSSLAAATCPFAFGKFDAFEGRESYHISKADISHYFRDITMDYEKVCLGSYFLEMADYQSVENMDERERLKLLFLTIRALESGKFSKNLIRDIYELRSWKISGEYPDVFRCVVCGGREGLSHFSIKLHGALCKSCAENNPGAPISQSCLYAMQFIISTPVEKLYTFILNDDTEKELTRFISEYRVSYRDHIYKSEEFL